MPTEKEGWSRPAAKENEGAERPLTFGERAVGLTFNPGGNPDVTRIKQHFANAIDDLNDKKNKSDNPEVKRMYSIAITDAQTAQMWAVKAATWQYSY